MEDILKIISWIELHPVVGAALLGSVAYTMQGLSKSVIKLIKNDSDYASPVFWTLGKKYRILAIHKYEHSDDASGYTAKQYSRPDLWEEFINIQSSFFNLRHKIKPVDKNDILAVIISRNGTEKHKVIHFNK